MLTDTTVGDCRAQLGWMVPDPDEFLQNLNQAVASIINGGLWEGTLREVVFNGSSGYITLPPFFKSIVGVNIGKCGSSQMVFSQYHQYVDCGPGFLDPTWPSNGPLTFMGDSFPTVVEMPNPSTLTFQLSNTADVGKVVRIFGTYANGTKIFDTTTGNDGLPITLAGVTQTFLTSLGTLTGIQKDIFKGTLTLSGNDGITVTTLSVYEPTETRPHYSRYRTGTLDSTFPIRCLCAITDRPLIADTDWVIPGDINALEFALQGIDYQHSRDYDSADKAFKRCYDQLNSEVRRLRGKAQPVLSVIGPMSQKYFMRGN